ncbi:hypothetical protein ACVGXB_00225, partial [Enterobacter intestinihominis]
MFYIIGDGKRVFFGAETKLVLVYASKKTDEKGGGAPVPNVKVSTAGKKMPLAVEGRGEFS